MKFVSVGPVPLLLTSFLFASLNGLTACGGGGAGLAPPPTGYTLSVTPQPASIPVNGSETFTATTNDPSDKVTWEISSIDPNQNVGSPTSAEGTTFVYTAPPTPPIYGQPIGTTNGTGFVPQGSVHLQALLSGYPMVEFNVAITAPSITTGFINIASTGTDNTVALGKTLEIEAYAVGSTNNNFTMQVNGITGGSTTYGTIMSSPDGLPYSIYTAPATMPMTGNTVTVTVISLADPTKSSSMTINLTSS